MESYLFSVQMCGDHCIRCATITLILSILFLVHSNPLCITKGKDTHSSSFVGLVVWKAIPKNRSPAYLNYLT